MRVPPPSSASHCRGPTVLPGASELLRHLTDKGKGIFYVSNNAGKTRQQYVDTLERMGFPAKKSQVFHAGFVVADHLRAKAVKKAYVVGSPGLCAELKEAGISFEYQEVVIDIHRSCCFIRKMRR